MASSRELQLEAKATIDDATSKLADLLASLTGLPDDESVKITIEDGEAKEQVENIKNDINDIPENVSTEFDVDSDNAESQIEALKSTIEEIDDNIIGVTIDADDNASDIADAVKSKIDELDGDVTNIVIEADDEASGVAESVKTELESIPQSVNIEITADSTGVDEATESTNNLSGSVVDVVGGLGLYKFGMEGLNFEKYISQAQIFSNATAEQRAEMEATVKSNSSATYSVNELSDAMLWLTKQTGDANVSNKLFGTELSFIKQNQVDLTSGITSLTKLYELYGLNTDEAATATSYLNAEIIKSGYTGNEFLNVVSKSSLDLKNLGFTLEDTGALVSAFGQSGINSSDALRMMRSGFKEFITEFDEGNPNIEEYEKNIQAAGVATRDANGNLRSSKDVLSDLMIAFSQMPEGPEKTRLAIELFGGSAGKVLGNLKVNYKDVENASGESAQGQIKAAQDVRKGTQDPLAWIMNELTKLTTGWGDVASHIVSYAGILVTGYGAWKIAGEKIISAILPDGIKERATVYFEDLKKLIPDKISELGESVKTRISQVFTKEKLLPEGQVTLEDLFKIDDGKLDTETGKINGFVERIKSKVSELKDTNIYRLLFGDEKSTPIEESNTKFTTLIDTIKTKIDELKGYNIWDKLFGTSSEETGRINTAKTDFDGTVDHIKGKIDELKGINIWDKIFGSSEGKTGATEAGGAAEAGATESEGNKLVDKIVNPIKNFNWKLLGLDIAGTLIEGLAMGIGIYFGEQDLERKQKEYEKYKRGEKADITPDEVEQMKKAEEIAQKRDKQGNKQEGTYGFDDLFNDIMKVKNAIPELQKVLDTLHLPEGLNQFLNLLTKILCAILGCSPGLIPAINQLQAKIKEFVEFLGSLNIPNPFAIIIQTIDGVKQKWEELKAWVGQKIEEIKGILNIPWNIIENGLNEAKEWVYARWDELKQWVNDRVEEIKSYLTIPWEKIESGLNEAKQWVIDRWNELQKFMEELPPKMYEAGKKAVEQMAEGVIKAIPGLQQALQFVRDHWPASPPKTGPLSTLTQDTLYGYGEGLGEALAGGIDSAMSKVGGYTYEPEPLDDKMRRAMGEATTKLREPQQHYYYGPNGEIQISLQEQQGYDSSKDYSHSGNDSTRNYPEAIQPGESSGGPSWEESLWDDLQSQLSGSTSGLEGFTGGLEGAIQGLGSFGDLGIFSPGLGSPSLGIYSPSMVNGPPPLSYYSPSMMNTPPSLGYYSPSMMNTSPSLGVFSPSMMAKSPQLGIFSPSMPEKTQYVMQKVTIQFQSGAVKLSGSSNTRKEGNDFINGVMDGATTRGGLRRQASMKNIRARHVL